MWKQLVGHSHPSFYTAIDNIRKDEAIVKTMILQDDRGEPPKKENKEKLCWYSECLKASIGEDIVAGRKSTEEFLRAVGHCVRF